MYAKDVPPGTIFYHGTKADLEVGDLITPGFGSNFVERGLKHIYFSAMLEAATWGAELAKGDGPRPHLHRRTDRAVRRRPQSHRQEISGQHDGVLPLGRTAAGHRRGAGMGRPSARTAPANADNLARRKAEGGAEIIED